MFLRNLKKKPEWAASCTQVYKDKQGLRYYKYNDELDMSVIRKGRIDQSLIELKYGSDFNDVLTAMKASVNQFDKKGKPDPNLSNVGYYIQELIDRDEILILPGILMTICANMLIREDENPSIVDEEILKQKVSTFTNEIQRGGLHGFFQRSGLLKLIGLSNISIVAFNRLMIDSEERHQKASLHLYISGPQSVSG